MSLSEDVVASVQPGLLPGRRATMCYASARASGDMRRGDGLQQTANLEDQWPLVGRVDELSRLEALLADPTAGGVLLVGPAGVGKTRLAHECLFIAEDRGYSTIYIVATRSVSAVPFGALAAVLPTVTHREGPAVDRADLLRRLGAALTERAGPQRLFLFVDDAHLLDDASSTLIHQLVTSRRAFVVATLREGEAASDVWSAMWKDTVVTRLDVGSLDVSSVEQLIHTVLEQPVDGSAVGQLVDSSGGNALFLRELLLGAVQDGSLRREEGMWRLEGPLAPSQRLVELVESRLTGLTSPQRFLMELVAFADPLGSLELRELSDSALAEQLERRGLLTSCVSGQRLELRPAHPVYGDVLRARTPATLVQSMARALAELVESTGTRGPEDTLRVATWRLIAGGGSPGLMLEAANVARWRFDFPLAERLARAAASAGAGFGADLLIAQLASLQGRSDDAEAQLSALAQCAETDDQRCLVSVARLDNRVWYLGYTREALALAKEAEALIRDPEWNDEVRAKRCWFLLGVSGPAAVLEAVQPLLDRASGRALVWASLIATAAFGRGGRFDDALEAAAKGYEAHVELDQPHPLDWYPSTHIEERCAALMQAGHLQQAAAEARQQYESALASGSIEEQALFAYRLSAIAIERGQLGAAVRWGREGVRLFRTLGKTQCVEFSLVYLTMAYALQGKGAEASAQLSAISELNLPPTLYQGVDLLHAQAWTAVAAGDTAGATKLLSEVVERAVQIGDTVGAVNALHGLARLGHAADVVDRMTDLHSQVEGPLAPVRYLHTTALADMDPVRLREATLGFERCGAMLLAAEASADEGVAWLRTGDSRKAAAATARAGALLRLCEGASTPALHSVEARARLTRAEWETARLVASGRTNKSVAREQFLSVRTVENRLQRVYEKIGISGRADLSMALELIDSLAEDTPASGSSGTDEPARPSMA